MIVNDALGPIETAIFNALTASEGLSAAVATVKKAGPPLVNWHVHSAVLRGHSVTAESFSSQAIEKLREEADALRPAILDETRSWFVHDECNTDGGHQDTARTELGAALHQLHTALCNLADKLSMVVKLQETERFSRLLNR